MFVEEPICQSTVPRAWYAGAVLSADAEVNPPIIETPSRGITSHAKRFSEYLLISDQFFTPNKRLHCCAAERKSYTGHTGQSRNSDCYSSLKCCPSLRLGLRLR